MRYEIFPEADGWKWRFVDGIEDFAHASRCLTWDQCLRAVELLRKTLVAPIVVIC